MSKKKPTGASDAEVIAMLKRYRCPTPFHEVRTRFLGNIASPVLSASPMETIKQLWGGELPEFDSMDAVNELFNVLTAVGHLGLTRRRYPSEFLPGESAVGRRRFEMFPYRAVLMRLRQGDTDRDIARAGLTGRPKTAALRALAAEHGWLDPGVALPEDSQIAQALGATQRARSCQIPRNSDSEMPQTQSWRGFPADYIAESTHTIPA